MKSGRLALTAFIAASAFSASLIGLLHVAGADPREVWASYRASLGLHLGALLSIVTVAFVGILFAFALGWIAVRLIGVLAVDAISLVTKPMSNAAMAVRDAGQSAIRSGSSLAQGALGGAAAVGNAAIDLAQRGAQLVPTLRSSSTEPSKPPEKV